MILSECNGLFEYYKKHRGRKENQLDRILRFGLGVNTSDQESEGGERSKDVRTEITKKRGHHSPTKYFLGHIF